MLEESQVDVVSITSYPNQHRAQAIAAAEAGKHIILEKPIALTWEDCTAILRAVGEVFRRSVSFELPVPAIVGARRFGLRLETTASAWGADLSLTVAELRFSAEVLPFVRGDANADGAIDLSDAIRLLLVLFRGEETSCAESLDVDADGRASVTDATALLAFAFSGGPPPASPFPECGYAPALLGCDLSPCDAL